MQQSLCVLRPFLYIINQTVCPGEDLNLHESPRLLLRQVRLPISPPEHTDYFSSVSQWMCEQECSTVRNRFQTTFLVLAFFLLILYTLATRNAFLAQLVEQLPLKETVQGSSPWGGTIIKTHIGAFLLLCLLNTLFSRHSICAGNGTWTHKSFRSQHFKCCASTDFATPAIYSIFYIIPLWLLSACATLVSVGKTFHISCFTYRFRHPGGFFWFRPRCVGWRLWQLGQRILKFSSRLSRWSPFMWSSSTGILPSFDISAQPQISHLGDFKPARKSRFFSLKLWKSESFFSIDSSDCCGTKSYFLPRRQPIPIKWELSKPSLLILCETCW